MNSALLEKASQRKTNFQEKIDFFGRHFTSIIALISVFTFLFWYFVLSASLEQTTLIALSVFIISCPCALVIATPLAFQVGLAKIAKAKAIFKSARNFGKIGKINTVVFDKTGSLTQVINDSTKYQNKKVNTEISAIILVKAKKINLFLKIRFSLRGFF